MLFAMHPSEEPMSEFWHANGNREIEKLFHVASIIRISKRQAKMLWREGEETFFRNCNATFLDAECLTERHIFEMENLVFWKRL